MICSTGRACAGILLVDRIGIMAMSWRKRQQHAAAVHRVLYRDGVNEYLCMYVLVRMVVAVVPLYGPWDGVVQDVLCNSSFEIA